MLTNIAYEPTGPVTEKAHYRANVDGNLVPFTLERPNSHFGTENLNEGIVVLGSGWTETEDSMKPLRHSLAKLGIAAVTVHHPRYIAPAKVLNAPNLRVDNISAIANGVANDFVGVSLAGHSMGGIDVTKAVHERCVAASTLTLLGSAGLIASSTFEQVAPNVFRELIQEESSLLKNPIGRVSFARKSLVTILRNPALAASEGIAAATHYVGRHIPDIVQRGIITANLIADGDKIFPPNEVLQSTKNLPFDVQEVMENSTHNFTYHQPARVARFILDVIESREMLLISRKKELKITQEEIEAQLFLRND